LKNVWKQDSKNFVETAAFGCPAAQAVVLPARTEFNAEMKDGSARKDSPPVRTAKNRPSGDGQPKAAVPTKSGD
jgi:hypothetical protein